jgi:hypothetical protein
LSFTRGCSISIAPAPVVIVMAFTLIEPAQHRWRAVNGPHLAALVRTGAIFDKGMLIERPNQHDQEAAA